MLPVIDMSTQPDPFRRMMRQMESAFEQFQDMTGDGTFSRVSTTIPVDIREGDGTITVTTDMPGVETEQIDVDVSTDTVRIRAEDVTAVAHEEEQFVRRERSSRQYQRTVRLPARVDPDSAEAAYENGVLTVTVEKTGDSARNVDVS